MNKSKTKQPKVLEVNGQVWVLTKDTKCDSEVEKLRAQLAEAEAVIIKMLDDLKEIPKSAPYYAICDAREYLSKWGSK